jgi:ADP-heptose:LPS heptosyltransferase
MKIVLIATLRLGDTAMLSPLLPALRNRYPLASIDIVVREGFEPLYVEDPEIEKVHTFKGKKEFLSLLRQNKYDMAINGFEGKFNKLLFLSRIPQRIGLQQKKRWRDFFFLTKSKKPRAAGFKDLLKELGSLICLDLEHPPRIITSATYPRSDYIVVHPGSLEKIRVWPYFSKLIEWLPHKVLLTGSKEEKTELDALAKNCPNVENLAGKTNLYELMGVLKGARLVIGNDTGPVQLAKALKTKTITIYGAAHPRTIGFPDTLALVHEVPCRPKNGFLFGMELENGGRCEYYECPHRTCLFDLPLKRVQEKIEEALCTNAPLK